MKMIVLFRETTPLLFQRLSLKTNLTEAYGKTTNHWLKAINGFHAKIKLKKLIRSPSITGLTGCWQNVCSLRLRLSLNRFALPTTAGKNVFTGCLQRTSASS